MGLRPRGRGVGQHGRRIPIEYATARRVFEGKPAECDKRVALHLQPRAPLLHLENGQGDGGCLNCFFHGIFRVERTDRHARNDDIVVVKGLWASRSIDIS